VPSRGATRQRQRNIANDQKRSPQGVIRTPSVHDITACAFVHVRQTPCHVVRRDLPMRSSSGAAFLPLDAHAARVARTPSVRRDSGTQ